jgi:hypothetical protein
MPLDALATLRQVNKTLRSALVRLRPERQTCSSIQPNDLADIHVQLAQATECLRPEQANRESSAFAEEKLAYRRNLEELKQFLPSLQVRLMAEKSRLEDAKNRVAAADAWAQARSKSL